MTDTIIDRLLRHVHDHPEKTAIQIVGDGETLTESLTFAELHARASAIAAWLQTQAGPGERALLLYEEIGEYVASFLGCLYAGVIAVPAYPPSTTQPHPLARLKAIAENAEPRLMLTQQSLLGAVRRFAPSAVTTDASTSLENRYWQPVARSPGDDAFLQYTSGSTAAPRGVRISHANIMANEKSISEAFCIQADDVIVSWLPLFHDMGLIGGLLQPLYSGVPVVLLSPAHFIERPIRWLRAISRFGGTVSGGPDFAYRLCVERMAPSALEDLDLRSWRLAFCGAEPIRTSTMRMFAAAFSANGFTSEALYPCYGLAEATLLVSGGRPGSGVSLSHANRQRENDEAWVGCGTAQALHEITIADPHTRLPLADGAVGEICVAGPSVASGYWSNASASAEVFKETDSGRQLRTGDLGFIEGGQLYVTGRIKDLILIRGQNFYPQDIEVAIERDLEVVRKGRVAAFAVHAEGAEGVGVAAEVSRGMRRLISTEKFFAAIDESVLQICGERAQIILLVEPGALPRTSSGKLQRLACRQAWRDGTLEAFAFRDTNERAQNAALDSASESWTHTEKLLARVWKEVLNIPIVERHDHFLLLGGSSVTAAQVVARVEDTLRISVPLRRLLEHPILSNAAAEVDCILAQSHRRLENGIPLAKRDRPIATTSAQTRMWFHWKLDPAGAVYNVAGALRLSGPLDVDALCASLDALLARHESLRTTFSNAGGVLHQIVGEPWPLTLHRVELSAFGPAALPGELEQRIQRQTQTPFDLERGPLVRATLYDTASLNYVLVLTVHHIIADGTSMNILVQELMAIYSALARHEQSELPHLTHQLADVASWLAQEPDAHREKLAAWVRRMGAEHPVQQLPHDRPRPPVQSYRAASLTCELPQEWVSELREFAARHHLTLYMLLLASFAALLQRYSGQMQVRVGSPIAGRSRMELEGVVGLLVNTQILCVPVDDSLSVRDWLQSVREVVLEAHTYSDVAFERVVEAINPQRSLAHHPLFQVMYNHRHDAFGGQASMAEVLVQLLDVPAVATQFDLSLDTIERGSALTAIWTYSTDLFDRETIQRASQHWLNLLRSLTEPEKRVCQLELLDADEKRWLRASGHARPVASPPDGLIHEWIEAQSSRTPAAIAVIFGDEQITYQLLNQCAKALAHRLSSMGVAPDVLVGVCARRSIELVVALLGILKSGGAFLPLEPEQPVDRMRQALEDARPALILIQDEACASPVIAGCGIACLTIDSVATVDGKDFPHAPPTRLSADNLAYCIFTSGSTGRPKGAANTHAGLRNRLHWMQRQYALNPQDRVLQKTPIGFDVSVWELFWPLMSGASLVMAAPDSHRDPHALAQAVTRHAVTTIHFVPSMLRAFLDSGELRACRSLRRVLCSGEALSAELRQAFHSQHGAALHNLYGPTEASIEVTAWECEPRTEAVSVPIGRPIDQTEICILSPSLNRVPAGVPGELYIGGIGLARAYLNRADLTADRFVPHPDGVGGGERLYRTGDLAKLRPDGAIEYVGRVDQQVKIRGVRIELGEIQSQLLEHAAVRNAVVTVRNDVHGEPALVAYVVPHIGDAGELKPDTALQDVRAFLATRLPDVMLPAQCVLMTEFPVTANGKLDFKSLPEPELSGRRQAYVEPRNSIERQLAQIWSAVLKVPRVGIHDDFFELGGHSLLATQISSRVREHLRMELSLRELFESRTVAGLATRLADRASTAMALRKPIERAQRPQRVPLSHAQRRLWFLWKLNPSSRSYDISGAIRLTGPLNRDGLQKAFNALVERHEALRTTFHSIDEEAYQIIDAPRPVFIAEAAHFDEPFDLYTGPLLRVALLQEAANVHMLYLTLHHIIADGWSLNLLARELLQLYEAFSNSKSPTLPELPIQYADYALWQQEWLLSEDAARQLQYWRTQLDPGVAPLELPSDRPRPSVLSDQGARLAFEIDSAWVSRIRSFAQAREVTVYSVLVTAFSILLQRFSGQSEFCLGATVANRNALETEGLIGFFVNMQALRLSMPLEASAEEWLRQVHDTLLDAQAHQDMPFDRIVETVNPERSLAQDPLFRVTVNHQWRDFDTLNPGGLLNVSAVDLNTQITQFDLSLNTDESAGRLSAAFTYRTDLFDVSSIERLSRYWIALLQALVEQPSRLLSRLPLLDSAAERQILALACAGEPEPASTLCLHELIEAQVARTPDALALICEQRCVRYAELNERANQLAHALRARGVGPEVLVGIGLDRSVEMVIALLGVLKAGGAYLPLDPDSPPDRLAFMSEEARPAVVITRAHLLERMAAAIHKYGAACVCLEREAEAIAACLKSDPRPRVHPLNLAYCLYTSGSTGRPKGIHISQRSLAHYVSWAARYYFRDSEHGGAFSLYSPLMFDLTVTSLFVPLVRGRPLRIFPAATALDAMLANSFAAGGGLDAIKLTPSHVALLRQMEISSTPVRRAIVGGEALLTDHVRQLRSWNASMEIYNEYGPTEATVGCLVKRVDREADARSMGRPIDAFSAYIVEPSGALAPFGMRGELLIGGVGLARGYANRPDLTAERFIPDPFGSTAGARLYRTGDQARLRPDGEFEYCGRLDHQVKLRGLRIELGEIEARLRESPRVKDAVVLAREDAQGGKRLVGYVVPDRSVVRQAQTRSIERAAECVLEWREVFAGGYGEAIAAPNFAGWNSNFTRAPLPDSHMCEWLDNTVARILELEPRRVLEIGCGVGLLVQHLARRCETYMGTDFSGQALGALRRWLQTQPALQQVELIQCDAAQVGAAVSGLAGAGQSRSRCFDTVLLNSVIQYFPDSDYLLKTLEDAIALLDETGSVWVGDVRNLRLLEAFHAAVAFAQSAEQTPVSQLKAHIQREIGREKELLIDPAFFCALPAVLPIKQVDVRLKQGRFDNELTRYRYDVVLHKQARVQLQFEACWDWRTQVREIAVLERMLDNRMPESVRVSGVPNKRLAEDLALLEILRTAEGRTPVRVLRERLSSMRFGGEDPELFFELGRARRYSVNVRWSQDSTDGGFDVELTKPRAGSAGDTVLEGAVEPQHLDACATREQLSAACNDPLNNRLVQQLPQHLREHLVPLLPEYMIPTQWMLLEALPLTANGKLDRNGLPEPETFELRSTYAPPQSTAERAMADVWKSLLNLSQVGLHENFFELGGDSIVAIQVVSRARRAGFSLTPRDLFQHQTIASLVAASLERGVRPEASPTAEHDELSGEVPLTPIQHSFFEWHIPQRQHWNQSLLLEWTASEPPDVHALEHAVRRLVERHDALRLRFRLEGGAWIQHYATSLECRCFEHVDLSGEADVSAAVKRVADAAHVSLNLTDGPLLRVMSLQLPQGRRQLLIVVHHLVVDGVSWRILIEDLQSSALPQQSLAFGRWARALNAYANDGALLTELPYWNDVLQGSDSALTATFSNACNAEGSVRRLEVCLDATETARLLKECGSAYRTHTVELLLAALARAVCELGGLDNVLIDLEGHGREAFQEGLDVSRTVGWFTSIYPVRLRPHRTRLGEHIKAIKETLRAVPNKGLGYGLLKHLRRAWPDTTPRPHILFNYLGQFDSRDAPGAPWRPVRFSVGEERCPEAQRTHLLEVGGIVHSGCLHLSMTFSVRAVDPQRIESLLDGFVENLRAIIKHCSDTQISGATPSDFSLAHLTQEQLDRLMLPYREVEDLYSLSPMQEGMLFHSLLEPLRDLYVNQHTCTLNAALDVDAFQAAWQHALSTHSVLRTAFLWEGVASPLQIVHRRTALPFELYDWQGKTHDEQARQLVELRRTDLRRGFDLSRPPLLRVTLVWLAQARYQLIWTDHHLLFDGWSSAQLLKEVLKAYDALAAGRAAPRAAATPFRRFVKWLAARDVADDMAFWRERLKGFDEPTQLVAHIEPVQQASTTSGDGTPGNGTLTRELSATLSAAIQAVGRRYHLTLSTLMQGVVAVLLSRYIHRDDIMFGVTVSGRDAPLPDIEQMLGVLINTMPLRARLPADQPTVQWLRTLQDEGLAARAHGFVPLVNLQSLTDVPRGTPLFDVLLVVENFPVDRAIRAGSSRLAMTGFEFVSRANYPLTITVVGGDRCAIRIDHDERLIAAHVAQTLAQHFEAILVSILASPEQSLRHVRLWPDSLVRQHVQQVRSRQRKIAPTESGLHQQFEKRALRSPGAIAVVCGSAQLTYAQLDARANQVAHYLRSQGVGPDALVGLNIERSLELIVGVLGILKAGGAWLPLEPTLPAERRAFMLQDARPRWVLTTDLLSPEAPELLSQPTTAPRSEARADNLAYCIYTSGSTGRPKGALLTHRNVLRLFAATQARFRFDEGDVWALFHSAAFDFSVWEIFGALLYGGKLVIVPFYTSRSPESFLKLLRDERVTVLNQTPSAFRQLAALPALESPDAARLALRCIVFGGEALQLKGLDRWLQRWQAHSLQLVNMYGITETTVHVTAQTVQAGEGASPIGEAISDLCVWLLDAELNPVPPGVCGEIYVSGDGLARGYLHRPGLTAERFVPHPWEHGERLYRSGDLARVDAQGRLEYIGRADQQVKIRGFRVELGEVEAHLGSYDSVQDAVVLLHEDVRGDVMLVAYVVPVPEALNAADTASAAAFAAKLREQLRASLPAYMIPAQVFVLDRLPLTVNGKLDRRALPAPSHSRNDATHTAPRNDLEATLARIWSEVFRFAEVGIDTSFFDLGGHSLHVTQLTARLQQELRIALPLRFVYEARDIESLASLIQPLLAANGSRTDEVDRLEALFAEVQEP